MTLLAKTAEHVAEYGNGMLTIARYSDGYAVAIAGRGIAGQFRDCLKTHSPERVMQIWIRIAGDNWSPFYKPNRMPR